MQKTSLCWRSVQVDNSSQTNPSPRWGHASCLVEDEMVFFGGYADSTYMNDMWSFNSSLCKWNLISGTGNIPQSRSNCTLNYDAVRNRVILFGGGGPNKLRYNGIYFLDWKSKEWTEVKPIKQSKIPTERTYHTAEFIDNYLLIFGGESHFDLDDLWIFDFNQKIWTEVCSTHVKPTPRRFHSSALVNNQMYVIAGCHGKYRSLNSIYSLDLTQFLLTNDYTSLRWKEVKLEGMSFLTRWGHSSSVYDGKIYVFAGRFSNDLNDLLVIDLENQVIKPVMKNPKDAPIPRRRHCATFIGSSLVLFGGFNGQYFNDLHYINVDDPHKYWWIKKPTYVPNVYSLCLDNETFTNQTITLANGGDKISYNRQFLTKGFRYQKHVEFFLSYLETNCGKKDAEDAIRFAYFGFGPILPEIFDIFKMKGSLNKPITFKEYYNNLGKTLREKTDVFTAVYNNSMIEPTGIMELKEGHGAEWEGSLDVLQRNMPLDVEFSVEGQSIRCSKFLLSLNSKYFKNLFSFQNRPSYKIKATAKVFKHLLMFVLSDYLLIDRALEVPDIIELLKLSKHYHLERLSSILEYYLISFSTASLSTMLTISVVHRLKNLQNYCTEIELRKEIFLRNNEVVNPFVQKEEERWQEVLGEVKLKRLGSQAGDCKQNVLKKCYFDIIQTKASFNKGETKGDKKISRVLEKEKENMEMN